MQIHELNNFTGSLGSGSYVAVDDGVDTGKLSTQQLLADTQREISNLNTSLNDRIDNIIAGGAAPSEAEIIDARLGADGIVYPSLGDAIRYQISDAKSDYIARTDDIAETFTALEAYLYKKNCYINSSLAEATVQDYNLYKIPIAAGDVVKLISTVPYDTDKFNISYALRLLDSSDNYVDVIRNSNRALYRADLNNTTKVIDALFIGDNSYKAIIVCAKYSDVYGYYVGKNSPKPILNQTIKNGVTLLSEENSIKTGKYYRDQSDVGNVVDTAFALWFPVKTGDRIECSTSIKDLSFKGKILYSDGTKVKITNSMTEYTATGDGFAYMFQHKDETNNYYLYPKDSLRIEAKNVVGDITQTSHFDGLSGVAFGTSLTYRALTTGGFLQYLPTISGMTFDNQGVGSSKIMTDMLAAIKNYSSYSGKRVALLEGFVNDWYYRSNVLGTWKDTAETTVCGCVRSAINYMLSQNPDLTVILILDPVGRNYGGNDNSSLAANSAGATQFEFYEEIAKVGESMGIPVIKLYAMSGMSENTPQYYIDNIHPNALGAKQTAYAIWSGMSDLYPSQV